MRTTTAFLAGAATVVVALAAGLGGGMVIANIVSPHQPKPAVETAKLERRAAEPIAKSNAPAEPVSYLAAIQAAATNPVVVSPAPQAPPQQAEPAPQTSTQAAAVPSEPERGPGSSAQPAVSAQPPTQTTARAASAASDNAQARRDARRAEERRSKAERRQQWAERRRNRDMRDDELREVERSVREDTERSSVLAAEPVSVGTPRIRLFGGDD